MRIAFEVLDKQNHNREDFDCGAKELNDFLEQLNREVDETIKGELTPYFEKKNTEN